MEFISAEEFLKQDEKVQETFINWWEPAKGDLFENNLIGGFGVVIDNKKHKNGLIPLLTEGQLRKFIEDKTGGIETIEHYIGIGEYDIKTLPLVDGIYENDIYEDLGDDLLQAYWKVAIEIAKHKTR